MPGEVYECPKGWGHIVFYERMMCPISGTTHCLDCKIGMKDTDAQNEWARLRKGESK